jgi:hypothetical protein
VRKGGIYPSKTGRNRRIDMSDDLIEELTVYHRRRLEEALKPMKNRNPLMSEGMLRPSAHIQNERDISPTILSNVHGEVWQETSVFHRTKNSRSRTKRRKCPQHLKSTLTPTCLGKREDISVSPGHMGQLSLALPF